MSTGKILPRRQQLTDQLLPRGSARELASPELDLDQLELDHHLDGSSPASFELTELT